MVDIEAESQDKARDLKLKYRLILQRYHSIAGIHKLLRNKQPSPRVKYLILVNVLSLIFFYRRYNGELLSDAEALGKALLKLLL